MINKIFKKLFVRFKVKSLAINFAVVAFLLFLSGILIFIAGVVALTNIFFQTIR